MSRPERRAAPGGVQARGEVRQEGLKKSCLGTRAEERAQRWNTEKESREERGWAIGERCFRGKGR